MNRIVPAVVTAAAISLGAFAGPAAANEYEPQILSAFEDQIKPWLTDPAIIEAIKAQNEAHAGLSDSDIDGMDQQWRAEAETGSGPLIDKVLAAALSKYLAEKKGQIGGVVTEMFVMDNKGLNVGQSDVTSDYMQGDEAKWQKTYGAGPDAVFVDEVEFDDATLPN